MAASAPTITLLSEGGVLVTLLLYLNLAQEDAGLLTFGVRLTYCLLLLSSLGLILFDVALAALNVLISA